MRDDQAFGNRDGSPRGRTAITRRLRRLVAGLLARLGRGRVNVSGLPTAEGFSPKHLYRSAEFPVLTHPPMVEAHSLRLPADEMVLGVERGGEARMYPTSTLRTHHIVNDRLANEPFVLTFCEKCFSGVGFLPVVEGHTLRFAVFAIYQGSFLMRDDRTGTLWAQMTGEGLVGPYAGRRLQPEPVQMTTYSRWLELHPDSLVPDPAVMSEPRRIRPGKQQLGPDFQASMVSWDRRLPRHTLVFGVEGPGGSRAWVVDPAHPGPRFLQDELGGVPFVLLGSPGVFPLAYDRRVEDAVVDLHLEGDLIVDGTGSLWGEDGRAVDGPLTGTALRFLPSHLSDWYAWSAYHPGTEVSFMTGSNVPSSPPGTG